MPEVKWVGDNYLEKSREDVGGYPGFVDAVPVLTLDDLEAWLKEHRTWHHKYNDDCRHVFEDLLAQVQAMKEGRT
jgi:hypothetical protein